MNDESAEKQSPVTYINRSDLEDRFGGFFEFIFTANARIDIEDLPCKVPNYRKILIELTDKGNSNNEYSNRIIIRKEKVSSFLDFLSAWYVSKLMSSYDASYNAGLNDGRNRRLESPPKGSNHRYYYEGYYAGRHPNV
jgi:hypothetical protein